MTPTPNPLLLSSSKVVYELKNFSIFELPVVEPSPSWLFAMKAQLDPKKSKSRRGSGCLVDILGECDREIPSLRFECVNEALKTALL